MPLYLYTAAKKDGTEMKGERDAENVPALARALRAENLFLLHAEEKGRASARAASLQETFERVASFLTPISLQDKIFFARNLSVMIDAGFSFTRALDAIAKESQNPKIKKMAEGLTYSVTEGKTFANALTPYEDVFGILFIHMVEVGEASGKLVSILKLLTRQMKKDYDLRRRVRGALIYPSIIIGLLIVIGFFMMTWVVPTLTDTIQELNVEIPASTQFIISLSTFLGNYALWIVGAVFALIILFWRFLKTTTGKAAFDRAILRMPIFGPLIQKFNVARFCRIFSYLITAGVPIVKSLDITSKVLGNSLFQDAVYRASREIQKGEQLHVIFERYPKLFQPTVLQMLSVGEETGKLSDMTLRLAIFYEEEVNSTTKNLSTVIEPILMVVIGLVVGFFAVSMLQPIYSSLGSI